MPTLGDYSNVYNTALLILQQKGFRLWYDGEADLYGAERDGWDFLAPTLGLVSIHEFRKPPCWREYWWLEEGPRLYGELPEKPPDFVPIWDRPSGRG